MARVTLESKDLVTIPNAAKELGVHKVTLYRRIKDEKVNYVVFGGIFFLHRSEVERLKKEAANGI